jgi:hypothetical protein
MAFPPAAVASLAEFPVDAFDGAAAATGSGLAGEEEGDPAAGGLAAAGADVPPRLLT